MNFCSRFAPLAITALALSTQGCVGDSTEAPGMNLHSHGEALAEAGSYYSWREEIPVCWQFGGFSSEKRITRNAVEASWESAAAVNFTGWGRCPSGSTRGVRIARRTGATSPSSDVGKRGASSDANMWLHMRPEQWSDRCEGDRTACLQWIARHEFGHALGFGHEQDRPDATGKCIGELEDDQIDPGAATPISPIYDAGSVMNYCAPRLSQLSPLDIDGVRRTYGFPHNHKTSHRACMGKSARLHTGDFNNDGRQDLLCHFANGTVGTELASSNGHFNSIAFTRQGRWCTGDSKLHVGDFNNDGTDDLLCHSADGDHAIDYGYGQGRFFGTNWSRNANWCRNNDLHVGDFDGNGSDDILCHSKRHGKFWIDHAEFGLFSGTDWDRDNNWCMTPESELHIGDMDGDDKDDLICTHDDGRIWIDYARGGFVGTDWHDRNVRFCVANAGLDTTLTRVADVDGDGSDDLICVNEFGGAVEVLFSNADAGFDPVAWSGLTSGNFCPVGNRMVIADFDESGTADFLCHSPSTGFHDTQYTPDFDRFPGWIGIPPFHYTWR